MRTYLTLFLEAHSYSLITTLPAKSAVFCMLSPSQTFPFPNSVPLFPSTVAQNIPALIYGNYANET